MMTTDTLPELQTPKYTETIRGVPCITLTEHEHLMREYALQAIAQATQAGVTLTEQEHLMREDALQAIAQATRAGVALLANMLESAQKEAQRLQKEVDRLQPRAEVTDHVIRKTYSDVMTALREENRHVIGGAVAIEIDMPVRFAHAILALRPSGAVTDGDKQGPLLVHDVAEIVGCTVHDVSRALVSMGKQPHSTNMALTPDDAVAVCKALRPQVAEKRVPMTPQQALDSVGGADCVNWWPAYIAGIRAAEAHHGITTQAKKETP